MTNTTPTPLEQNDYIVSSFRLSAQGLTPIGEPTFDEWIEAGKFIHKSSESVHFWIGDYINYGQFKYGETYKQAIEMFGFDIQTLRADKWVSNRIPTEKRRPELSFDHHRTVADLEPEDQEELLAKAQELKMPTAAFRKYVKDWESAGTAPKTEPQEVLRRRNTSQDVTPLILKATELLSLIDATDFDALPPKLRSTALRALEPLEKRIYGLMMEYKEDED